MVKLFITQFIIIIFIILAVLGVIYGSFFSFKKAQSYVYAVNNLGSIRTIDELKKNFDKVFNYYSPVGGEESARFTEQTFLGIVSQGNIPENVSMELTNYIEKHILKNNTKQLLLMASIYETRWRRYRKTEDLEKIKEYYQTILNFGPKLPMPLYGLFNIYQQTGELEKAKEIGEIILRYWPEDENIKTQEHENK